MSSMLWQRYVFRRRNEVPEFWDELFRNRKSRVLYIAGGGFDVRVTKVTEQFLSTVNAMQDKPETCDLLLVNIQGYELSPELIKQTQENQDGLRAMFSGFGNVIEETIGVVEDTEEDLSATNLLAKGTKNVVSHINGYTDIILDVSSLPRVVYLSLMIRILGRLVPDRKKDDALYAKGVNFQVLVGEDPKLDGLIMSEDPSNELVTIPGFSGALKLDSVKEWPFVWFPVLGENRIGQLERVINHEVPTDAEVCPVLPHPSKNPRRADKLLLEYRDQLFEKMGAPTSNVMYAHEAHPFEAYRQLFNAMERYRKSFELLGGCRLVVTPLSSKLMTLGVGLACFNMRPASEQDKHLLAIPYAEPKRYRVEGAQLHASKPEIAVLLLTGLAYQKAPATQGGVTAET
jgi:hypothetical protein